MIIFQHIFNQYTVHQQTSGSYYAQMEKTWNSGERSQEWPAYQDNLRSASKTHPKGHKKNPEQHLKNSGLTFLS